jgi:hypothetical protein
MTDPGTECGDGPAWADAAPGLIAALTDIRDISDRAMYGFSDTEILDNLRILHAIIATAEAAKLGFVAELSHRPDAVPGAFHGGAAMTFLTEALHQSRPHAARDIAAATAITSTNPELPAMGQALTDGKVSREHLDVAVSTLRRIPQALKTRIIEDQDGTTRTGAEIIDEVLTDQARHLPPTTIARLGRSYGVSAVPIGC